MSLQEPPEAEPDIKTGAESLSRPPSSASEGEASDVAVAVADSDKKVAKEEGPERPLRQLHEYTEEELSTLVKKCKRIVTLYELTEDDWSPDILAVIERYFKSGESLLSVYINNTELEACIGLPNVAVHDLTYFYRESRDDRITSQNFHDMVIFGTCNLNVEASLLSIVENVYAPVLFNTTSWPDSVKSDFCADTHTFLGDLTDLTNKLLGLTVIYVPKEGLNVAVDQAVYDKELIKRLEGVVVYWMKQLRVALGDDYQSTVRQLLCPKDEYDFWVYRYENLRGLEHQLANKDLQNICDILAASQSAYLKNFNQIKGNLLESLNEAKSNIEYLYFLLKPCAEFDGIESVADIPEKLPNLLNLIRVIWINSPYYNTSVRLTGLCRSLSNKMILECIKTVDLDDILIRGQTRTGINTLQMCINCCQHYKVLYDKMAEVHTQNSDIPWDLDKPTIFNHVDSFVQRCADTIEVCEAMIVFGRIDETEDVKKPMFFGARGPEFEKVCSKLEEMFNKALEDIKSFRRVILNVQDSTWCDTIFTFRKRMRDVEVMIENLVSCVFETSVNVEEGINALWATFHYTKRDKLKEFFSKKTVQVYQLMANEIAIVKDSLVQINESCPAFLPYYGGRVMQAKTKMRALRRTFQTLEEAEWMFPCSLRDQVRSQMDALSASVEEHTNTLHRQWLQSLPDDCMTLLHCPLMINSHTHQELLEPNFNRSLRDLVRETSLFVQMNFMVPAPVQALLNRWPSTTFMYQCVLNVVLDYNRIIAALSGEERALFKELIKVCDKKINPGLSRLMWDSDVSDLYISDCVAFTAELQDFIDDYKKCLQQVIKLCEKICDSPLISLSQTTAYDMLDLGDHMYQYRKDVTSKIVSYYNEMIDYIVVIHESFEDHLNEMQNHWARFILKMDLLLEEALLVCYRSSLRIMLQVLHGDQRTGPNQLIGVRASLKDGRICFSPTLTQVGAMISNMKSSLLDSVKGIPRIWEKFHTKSTCRSFFQVIDDDDECRKYQNGLNAEMAFAMGKMREYLNGYEPFEDIWKINKEEFIKQYEASNPTVEMFEKLIAEYSDLANKVQMLDTMTQEHFLIINSAALKQNILEHCILWQKVLTELLLKMTDANLTSIYDYTEKWGDRINQEPKNLAELQAAIALLDVLKAEVPAKEELFPIIRRQIFTLQLYDMEIRENMREMDKGLDSRWAWYLEKLKSGEGMLVISKDTFQKQLIKDSEHLKTKAHEIYLNLLANGPYTSDWTAKKALDYIHDDMGLLNGMKETEAQLTANLAIFHITMPESLDLQNLDKELTSLEIVWELTDEWNNAWESYKTGNFWQIKTAHMDNTAQTLFRQLNALSRELKDKDWEIVTHTRNRVDAFRKTLPLIADLKNTAMRDRHWDRVRKALNRHFDEEDASFTLEKIMELEMMNYAQVIGQISLAATMELAIENQLKNIAEIWKTMKIELQQYKDKAKGTYIVKSADEIFQILEEHQVALSTMKSTKYVEPFYDIVDHWERTLSLIMEVVEAIFSIQREWIYLDNIFAGEDIRKQLPAETGIFDHITHTWKEIMNLIKSDLNAKVATHHPGMLNKLNGLTERLEGIQRALEKYLETKRHVFPRFYFISNEDLLEILANSRKPEMIQPHLKKLFAAILSLKMLKTPVRMEARGMASLDGEFVEFPKVVGLDGPVEVWLNDVEAIMRITLRDLLQQCRSSLRQNLQKRDKWFKEWPGQLCITSSQIQWTSDCTRTTLQCKAAQSRKPMKKLRKRMNQVLMKFSDAIRSELRKIERLKIAGLVTIEIHSRDVIDQMYKAGVQDISSFEWLKQLRFYWDHEIDDCVVRQTNTRFVYQYEYLGNSERLVITPLTDRCYITLTTALHLHRGGSPKGPAGTGKTETVKDLGKGLGMYVIVINCSEGLDYLSIGKMFSGLAQSGTWGCFDEFNRINIEVLSVVAQQILCILSALSAEVDRFVFNGFDVQIKETCGIFVTMNPGYAGRTELPDNLKAMFRPMAMMVPDSAMIAEIMLFGEGFRDTRVLAKKAFTLFFLTKQQLSKQDHYEWGLRGLVTLIRYSGKKRMQHPNLPEDEILLLSMKDMNLAKLTQDDVPLFLGIVSDLFPGVETPTVDYSLMTRAIEADMTEAKLQVVPAAVLKILQLYETKNSRHSVVLCGKTGAAKSATWKTLQGVLSRLAAEGQPGFVKVEVLPINPKALSQRELYGEFDLSTNEWMDGVISLTMRTCCASTTLDQKWILLDGPIDAVWIENMNSVMDDNKVLTLVNSERIVMPPQVSLLFEVEDMSEASPATVSRCGIVYNDYNELGWQPYVNSWLQQHPNQAIAQELRTQFHRLVNPILEFKRLHCVEPVPVSETSCIMTLCYLLSALATVENGLDPSDESTFSNTVKLWFMFCAIWSLCCSVDEAGRKRLDNYIREYEGGFPLKDTIYEYFVDGRTRAYMTWETKLSENWKMNPYLPFYKIIVPTVDTVRYDFLVNTLLAAKHSPLLVGSVGTGKTSTAVSVLDNLDPSRYALLFINMSAQTSSPNVQDMIQSRLEKRTKGIYVPLGGKRLITFMDDLNMPAREEYGAQPPLELIRHWLDYGFWYNRTKQFRMHVQNMLLMAAMGTPGGGRNVISNRLLSRFCTINITFPSEEQISRIFGTMLNQQLQDFSEVLKAIAPNITAATIDVYETVSTKMLPTPAKMHYMFNLRDISRVFQGLLRSHKDYQNTKNSLLRLWIHECFRVFHDRLVDFTDREWFTNLINIMLGKHFELTFHSICPSKKSPIYCDFCNKSRIYEDMGDGNTLRSFLNQTMEDYNNKSGVVPLNLVLFMDAVEHICHIERVISQPRGNVLLVGVGGSGRQSLTKVATILSELSLFQIEVTKFYRLQEFREDMKLLYSAAGVENKPTCFVITDSQITDERFVEVINNILSSGEVPNLYKLEEFEELKTRLEDAAAREKIPPTTEALYNFLVDRAKANLHVVVCLSPIGDAFKDRIRQFPALVNCTTIDWFLEWPREALMEVANKYFMDLDFTTTITGESVKRVVETAKDTKYDSPQEKVREAVASICATIHSSVSAKSKLMYAEIKRHNYVTPSSFLELVAGYIVMLKNKRIELAQQANKLRSGLSKIDDTRVKVEEMSAELQVAQTQVVEYQKQCDDYLVIIVAQKREADEQSKEVASKSIKIAEEELACSKLADIAQADLDEAMPALNEALQALDALNKKDVAEIRSYPKPPYKVEIVMEAVMILKKVEPTWAEAKRQLGDVDFLNKLRDFDKDHIPDRVLRKIAGYTNREDFDPESVGTVSIAAKSLCLWVRAIEKYAKVYKIVAPKKAKLEEAMKSLREKQTLLADAQAKLAELANKLEKLQHEYEEKQRQKEELRQKAELLMARLDRAATMIDGLAGERERWTQTVAMLDHLFHLLPGDVLLTTGSLAYLGPFVSQYRESLMALWKKNVVEEEVPMSPDYSLIDFLADPTLVREWSIHALPSDLFSIENGVMTTHATRWPLIIDPQCQAWRWIKNMETPRGLRVVDFGTQGYLQQIEEAMTLGKPVLLHNVLETLDPAIRPVLQKSIRPSASGKGYEIRMGNRFVSYDPNFRFFITTKLPNPHYSPEISTATTIINFAIKEEGLEGQLLGFVVRKEKPKLEEQKDYLVTTIASGKKKLKEMEDELLRLLYESEGSLLDNEELFQTLQVSKATSIEVKESLAVSELTEIQIDEAREAYRPCARRASILFFVLTDLGQIDPMYQFSLESYTQLFNLSIDKSGRSNVLEDRINNLNDYHTYAFYKNTCRALFERHKLLFAFHMCVKILNAQGKISAAEYNYFLRGGVVLDRSSQPENPCGWMPAALWDNITELDKIAGFHGVVSSFEEYPKEWHHWFQSQEPENNPLMGDWQEICTEFQRILVVRALRLDRISYCVTSFLVNTLGGRFVEPPVLDVKSVLEDSVATMPLIFVLSPGVDPTSTLLALVEASDMSERFHSLSLGQGQSPIATRMLKQGITEGNWVFLANCHLSLSWMPQLDKLIENLRSENVHPRFRLWLSSSPSPGFPISILQASLKMTTEPPKGLKANLKRLYNSITVETFSACQTQQKYRKLLFALCFFHSVLLERKKFEQLGWNIVYSFNDSDFEVSENLISIYLDEYPDTPWEALTYLIAGINYGGHVTDDWDRRLLMTYINQYFTEEALTVPNYRLSPMATYYIPRDGSLQSYRDYIKVLPSVDQPQAFGQHPNADITSLLSESSMLTSTLQSLQIGSTTAYAGENIETKVLQLAADIVSKVPDPIDYENANRLIGKYKTPLDVVLLQEITRYNVLLVNIKESLVALDKAVQGLIVMSTELEDVFSCINDGRVPASWLKAYPSTMPLGSWTRDLVHRVAHFARWAATVKPPTLFWLAAYTFPTGFLTAVLQTAARANKVSIDLLSWEFSVLNIEENLFVEPSADGVYIRTMYLEGAGWDRKQGCLSEPLPMQLIVNMPVIHFKPVEILKRKTKGLYNCPCYYFPIRCGAQGRESYVVAVDLKSGSEHPDHWVKRATALLLSLNV